MLCLSQLDWKYEPATADRKATLSQTKLILFAAADCHRVRFVDDGDDGEQEEVSIHIGIVGDQHPEDLGAAGQANREPAQADSDRAHGACVGESDLSVQTERDGCGQVRERFLFPAIQPVVGGVSLQRRFAAGRRRT